MGLKTMNAALMALVVICFAIQVSSHSSSHQQEVMMHKVISDALSSKGYAAMSLILEDTLLKYIIPLISSSSSSHQYFTIFVPQDKAFFTLKYGQPPITLFKFQIAPLKISDNNYYSSPFEVESLIPGHPFVLTALPGADSFTCVNDVKITDWNLYTDKHIAIHGVEDFFDPPATLTSNPLTSVI